MGVEVMVDDIFVVGVYLEWWFYFMGVIIS